MPYVWAISLTAALGGLMFGYDWIVISGSKPFYERFFDVQTPAAEGWAMASALVGCLFGAALCGGLSDRLGRKWLLVLAAALFLVSSIGTALVDSFFAFNVWRVMGGLAIGLASNLSPMYIAEIAPAAWRGRLVAMNQFTIVIGILLAQGANYTIAKHGGDVDKAAVTQARLEPAALDAREMAWELAWQVSGDHRPKLMEEFEQSYARLAAGKPGDPSNAVEAIWQINDTRGDDKLQIEPAALELAGRHLATWNAKLGWRWMFGVTAIPACLFCVLMLLVPESPRWLAKNGRGQAAHRVLTRIGGQAHADRELAGIEETLAGETRRVDFRELVEPRMLTVLVLGVTLAVLQQWCGINVIFYYATEIFKKAGYAVSEALLNIVLIGAVNLVFTVIALFSVDRFGRRILMIIGFAGLAMLHTLIGLLSYYHLQGTPVLLLTLAAIGCYGLSLAPITWVVLSEIFPNRIRGAALSISVIALWAACFILTFTFPLLRDHLGLAGTFWIYAAICAAGLLFVLARLPETKGKSLEEIEHALTGRRDISSRVPLGKGSEKIGLGKT
jgi:MFS family permease